MSKRARLRGDMHELVRELMQRVHAKMDDAELAREIAPKLGRRYGDLEGAISNWRTLWERMPAEALLAACQVTGVSIDEVLLGSSDVQALRNEIQAGLASVGERLAALESQRPAR